jgi:tRNA C32,U32 (ribose-2'-O)-methylase TrmJ
VAGTGEQFVLQNEIEKAQVQAVRAHDELQRAGASDEFGPRLAALEAAINTTNQALQWRKTAIDEISAVARCIELAQVGIANNLSKQSDG